MEKTMKLNADRLGRLVQEELLKKTNLPRTFTDEELEEIGKALEQEMFNKFIRSLQNINVVRSHAKRFVKDFWPVLRERIEAEVEIAKLKEGVDE